MNMTTDSIAAALGADRMLTLDTDAGGPLSWLQLRDELARRMASAGTEPGTSPRKFRQLIPLRETSWHYLTQLAGKLRDQGTSVRPDQLASILLERQIQALQDAATSG